MKCRACELEAYQPSDLEGYQPPVLNHTCESRGPKTKGQILKALERAANALYHSPSAKMPGGNYHAKNEIDALLWRLADRPQVGI